MADTECVRAYGAQAPAQQEELALAARPLAPLEKLQLETHAESSAQFGPKSVPYFSSAAEANHSARSLSLHASDGVPNADHAYMISSKVVVTTAS